MTPKELQAVLGIDANRIKYFKRSGLFFPENPPVGNRPTIYTLKDFQRLKELVYLTSVGLTCGDIRAIEIGHQDIEKTVETRIHILQEDIEIKKALIKSLGSYLQILGTTENISFLQSLKSQDPEK